MYGRAGVLAGARIVLLRPVWLLLCGKIRAAGACECLRLTALHLAASIVRSFIDISSLYLWPLELPFGRKGLFS